MKIAGLQISSGHNFFGRHGKPAGTHEMVAVDRVKCVRGAGLEGDRFLNYKRDYAGQITFFAEEIHQSLLRELPPPEPRSALAYRRNVITRGVDLNSLIGVEFTVQGVRFSGSAECKPCYWMDQAVGPGTENFLKGNGGLRARILSDGELPVDCPTAAGLLLAGGRSTRMGTDKNKLDWKGRSLAEYQAMTLAASGAWPLYLSCRADQPETPPGFKRLEDERDGGALEAFVASFGRHAAEVVTVLAVDLPHMTPVLLRAIAGVARDHGNTVVPRVNGHFEPLAAAWHRSAVPALREGLTLGRSLQATCAALEAAGKLRVFPVADADVRSFANANSPEDWRRLTG
jgi:molybdopterin-guanine dinucleotide biosynthesis protein A/MOSC domain-containing protein YiiM